MGLIYIRDRVCFAFFNAGQRTGKVRVGAKEFNKKERTVEGLFSAVLKC